MSSHVHPTVARRIAKRCTVAAFVCWSSILLGANAARAIEVEEVVWGFDGRTSVYHFNLLSVLLSNPTPEPFDGSLRLQRMFGAGHPVGAALDERVFVSPFASRWVQFYPYVIQGGNEWLLTWNRGARQYRVPAAAPSLEPSRIILENSRRLASRGGSLKRLPANLFPPMVTATDTLRAVVLDHAPRWEAARRRAFLDWLYGGGIVHVIYEANGKYPEFPTSLSELNAPLERNRVGAGLVFRHPITRDELDANFVDSVIRTDGRRPTTAEAENPDGERAATNEDGVEPDAEDNGQVYAYGSYGGWNSDAGFFNNLKQMTRVKHSWNLIYLMSIVYALLIFPGCYVLGRKRIDYRITLSALLATVALFSVGFSYIGRRGYGESTAVHAVAVARPLADGNYDVLQWSNVFVTDGDTYALQHGGSGGLYTTGQQDEAVNGIINNGLEGQFVVDIPPFSSRTFAHRLKVKGKRVSVEVVSWEADQTLSQLNLHVSQHFPKTTHPIYALYRDSVYRIQRQVEELSLIANIRSVPVPEFLRLDENSAFYSSTRRFFAVEDGRSPEERFRTMIQPLMARNLDLGDANDIKTFSLPDDRIRIFVFAPMTEEFFVQNERLRLQSGYVLYCFDVFFPESSSP